MPSTSLSTQAFRRVGSSPRVHMHSRLMPHRGTPVKGFSAVASSVDQWSRSASVFPIDNCYVLLLNGRAAAVMLANHKLALTVISHPWFIGKRRCATNTRPSQYEIGIHESEHDGRPWAISILKDGLRSAAILISQTSSRRREAVLLRCREVAKSWCGISLMRFNPFFA